MIANSDFKKNYFDPCLVKDRYQKVYILYEMFTKHYKNTVVFSYITQQNLADIKFFTHSALIALPGLATSNEPQCLKNLEIHWIIIYGTSSFL